MKITSTTLAWVCLGLLALCPVFVILIWSYIDYKSNHGTVAAVLATNAGTALLVSLVFSFPEFKHQATRNLTYWVIFVGGASGLLSAVFWIMDEVGNLYLPAAFIAPFVVILLVLVWFTSKVSKEGTSDEGK